MELNLDTLEIEESDHETNPLNENEPVEEPTGIGSRLPTRERHPPREWWKPWELPQSNMDQGSTWQTLPGNHRENPGVMQKQ